MLVSRKTKFPWLEIEGRVFFRKTIDVAMNNAGSPEKARILVFTDLDGTFLDHATYSFDPALPAVSALQMRGIPLIFCSSKTRPEIEAIRRKIQNEHPFISENGGAVFIPKSYFGFSFIFHKEEKSYLIVELGTSYAQLRAALEKIRAEISGRITGFGDLSSQEVAELCGISLEEARLAQIREYDEPFILENPEDAENVAEVAARLNLQVSQGGRFYHLTGANDKGQAIRMLSRLYIQKFGAVQTIALGDGLNDLPMLEAADFPVLIQKPDGSSDPGIGLNKIIRAPSHGPRGWSLALLDLLSTIEANKATLSVTEISEGEENG